jgi:hypothetical protein
MFIDAKADDAERKNQIYHVLRKPGLPPMGITYIKEQTTLLSSQNPI